MNRVRHVSELLLGRDRLPFDVEGHNANRSRGWTQYAGDGPQRRGFARTVRSDEADDFTRVHGETQVAYRSELAVVPGEIFDLNHRSVELLQEENGAPFIHNRADDRFQDVAAHHRVETGTRFVEQQQFRPVRQREQQARLRAFAALKAFDSGRRVEAELSAQLPGVGRVPLWIKGLRIAEQFIHAHPKRQIALLGKVANPAQHTDRVRDRVEPKHADRTALCFEQTEDVFDERGFARAVFTDQSEDYAARNIE